MGHNSRGGVACAITDGVAVVTRDNPPLNVTTLAMARELDECLSLLAGDEQVRAVVITGAGDRSFGAGSDISEFPSFIERGDVLARKTTFQNVAFGHLYNFPKPTLAALNGSAYGGGLELAVCCDLIIAEEGTFVGLPEIKLGVFPGAGAPVRVTRRIGETRAKELMLLGDPIPAEVALSWGLVNKVVPRGSALAEATTLAQRLAHGPSDALRACKAAIALAFDGSATEMIKASEPLFESVFAGHEVREGVRAFFAKTQPTF